MCFSAIASLSAAALTGSVGAVTLTKVTALKELPLASVPLLFGLQQALEGSLWVTLGRSGPGTVYYGALADSFVAIALVMWPVLIPVAAGLVEPKPARKFLFAGLGLMGLALGCFGVADMVASPFSARVIQHSVCYVNATEYPLSLILAYLLCTCAPLLLSTSPALRLFGVIVTIGAATSAGFFYVGFISVWCFFAASASGVLYLYFRQRHAAWMVRFALAQG